MRLAVFVTTLFDPIRLRQIVNDTSLPVDERVEKAVAHLTSVIIDDIQGSREYRAFVLKNVLLDTLKELEMEN